MPEGKAIAGMPSIHTFSVLRFCPPQVWAHLSVIPALCPAGGGFVAALGLVALTLKGCCLQRPVYYSRHFILGKFLSFPGDEAWATFAPAWVILEGLEPCFVIQVSKSGCGAWEFPARAVTIAHQKWVPRAPPLSHFSKEWVLWVFLSWAMLKETRQKLKMKCLNLVC